MYRDNTELEGKQTYTARQWEMSIAPVSVTCDFYIKRRQTRDWKHVTENM